MTKVNTVIAAFNNDWDVCEPVKAEKTKEYLEFNTPPLALVIAMQEADKESHEIYSTLQGVGKMHGRINSEAVVTVEHQKRAAEIYDYFAKKHTLRRIKGEYISEYMLSLDDLCDTRKKINEEHVKILVSLPRIYKQNKDLERIMKGRNSAKKLVNLSFASWRGTVEFVEKVHIKSGHKDEYHYYFSTPRNYLMRVVVKKSDYGSVAWDVLSRAGRLDINAEVVYTYAIKGYDFNVLQFSPKHTEVKIA
jgi:hypothetical protein